MMDNKFFKPTIALSFIAMLVMGCDNISSDHENAQENPEGIEVADQIVQTVLPTMQNFTKELKVVGSVLPMQEVDILPLESGQIQSILVDIGDYVKKDQILVVLDNPLITREVDALKVEAEAAENTLSRMQKAVKSAPGLVAASDLDEAEAASARASAALAAGLDRMRFLSVRAPFDGIVSARNVHPGALVENGLTAPSSTPMLSIVSCKEIRILLPYPERDMRFIHEGGEVELNFPDLDRTINTTVSRVAASIDASSRTVDVLVDIKSDDCTIRPGIYVEGSLEGGSRESILTLQAGVRFIKNGLPFASIVEDGLVSTIPLTIHAENKTHIGFSAEGVDETTEFIITGRNLVSDGGMVTTKLLK
jgi:RND family efflux transporter MFP subunit